MIRESAGKKVKLVRRDARGWNREMMMDGEGRREGRPTLMWMDGLNVDLRETGLSGEETQNIAVCVEANYQIYQSYIDVGKYAVEENEDKS